MLKQLLFIVGVSVALAAAYSPTCQSKNGLPFDPAFIVEDAYFCLDTNNLYLPEWLGTPIGDRFISQQSNAVGFQTEYAWFGDWENYKANIDVSVEYYQMPYNCINLTVAPGVVQEVCNQATLKERFGLLLHKDNCTRASGGDHGLQVYFPERSHGKEDYNDYILGKVEERVGKWGKKHSCDQSHFDAAPVATGECARGEEHLATLPGCTDLDTEEYLAPAHPILAELRGYFTQLPGIRPLAWTVRFRLNQPMSQQALIDMLAAGQWPVSRGVELLWFDPCFIQFITTQDPSCLYAKRTAAPENVEELADAALNGIPLRYQHMLKMNPHRHTTDAAVADHFAAKHGYKL